MVFKHFYLTQSGSFWKKYGHPWFNHLMAFNAKTLMWKLTVLLHFHYNESAFMTCDFPIQSLAVSDIIWFCIEIVRLYLLVLIKVLVIRIHSGCSWGRDLMAEQSPEHGLLIEGVRLPLCWKQQWSQRPFSSVSRSRTTCSEKAALHGESAVGGTLQRTINERIPEDSLLPTNTTTHPSVEQYKGAVAVR